jgi:hypothetical protein
MAYSRGTSTNIIVGAAAIFVADYKLTPTGATAIPSFVATESYKSTLSVDPDFTNVGYTMNGLELTFTPDFGEVAVDQVLDVAKLYKQGMQVSLATAFAEATLENLLLATAGKDSALTGTKTTSALSIEAVTVSAKREEASMFEVSFRMLPDDTTATYGKIVDRTFYDGSGTNYTTA